MRRTQLVRPVACLALSLSWMARAQAPTPKVERPAEQQASPPDTAPPTSDEVFVVPTVEVTGQAPVSEAPDAARRRDPTGAITVIDARSHDGEARDTAELLSGGAGLAVQDTGGFGQSKGVVVRGASSNGVLVFLDGIPLNGAGGMADLSLVPAALVDHIEVLRGGAGARYGAGGLGGAIRIVTRPPEGTLRASGEVTYGSWDTVLGQLAATGPLLDGQVMLLVHGGRSEGNFRYRVDDLPAVEGNPLTEQVRTRNDARGGGALLRYQRELRDGARMDVLAELALENRGLAGTVQNPQTTGRQDLGRVSLGLRWARPLANAGELSARGFFRREGLDVTGGVPEMDGGAQRQTVGGVELEGRTLLGDVHAVSVAVAGSAEAVTEALHTQEASWWRASVMVMDELLLWGGRLGVAPSLRLERVGPYWLVAPKLGASLDVGHGFAVRANAGQSHRAPSFLELYIRQGTLLPNPSLQPERGLYADAAVTWRREGWSASAGGFAALYDNLIAYELYPPLLAKPYNFAAARVWGAELEVEARPLPWLTAGSSYTWMRTQNRFDDPRFLDKDLPYRPRHKWMGRVRAGPDWLNARAEVIYQSAQFFNRTGSLTLPDRTWVSAGASSTFLRHPDVTVSVELKNLLDAQTSDFSGYPLPGRAAYVTLGVALDPPAASPSSQENHGPQAPNP
ncbi:TonB-dependent receptor [Corallococcus sp. M34]|uniref:TonB-dependent receptor plug domain-containing protein n=1 Tax=Citreicoccus inhibens TaxID=2849499 RepID=UPI001C225E75|nr:TonB-dependent receptor [Citreicoccus inhibens]MBU8895602.1 TonB-dependent receptor [Citreicoccus inhibens]